MSIITDTKFLSLPSPRLERSKKVRDYLWNFRCPYCGDSKKSQSKARGFVFRKKSDLFYKCHNCNIGTNLSNLVISNTYFSGGSNLEILIIISSVKLLKYIFSSLSGKFFNLKGFPIVTVIVPLGLKTLKSPFRCSVPLIATGTIVGLWDFAIFAAPDLSLIHI